MRKAEMVKYLEAAIKREQVLIAGWAKDTNPQVVAMRHDSEGREVAFSICLNAVLGHPYDLAHYGVLPGLSVEVNHG